VSEGGSESESCSRVESSAILDCFELTDKL
jgi:hypothetical protein